MFGLLLNFAGVENIRVEGTGNGGGHACSCGATVQDKKEMRKLVADADKLLGEYKASNGGWL